MNGKQARMLRRVRATKQQKRAFKAMTGEQRGQFRRWFLACPWLTYPSFDQVLARVDWVTT